MIKTLRITTIIAAILAVGLLAFPVVYGYRGAEQEKIEEFLGSPGVLEMFNQAKGTKNVRKADQIPPLVMQAGKFGLYLNPPVVSRPTPTPKPTTKVTRREVATPDPPKSTAKFTLIGTSFYKSRPELSLAYIDEVGKGLHWVRQGAEVGHMTIEQVNDGSIVVKDRQKSVTLVANRPPKKSLLKSDSTSKSIPVLQNSSSSVSSIVPTQATSSTRVATSTIEKPAVEKPSTPVKATTAKKPSFEEMAMMAKMIAEAGASMKADGDKNDSQAKAEKSKALMDKFISELENMRVPTEEAKRLDRLGKELNNAQSDPNRPPSSKMPQLRSTPRRPRPPR